MLSRTTPKQTLYILSTHSSTNRGIFAIRHSIASAKVPTSQSTNKYLPSCLQRHPPHALDRISWSFSRSVMGTNCSAAMSTGLRSWRSMLPMATSSYLLMSATHLTIYLVFLNLEMGTTSAIFRNACTKETSAVCIAKPVWTSLVVVVATVMKSFLASTLR